MRIKRLSKPSIIVLILFAAVFFFLNTWQGYRYEKLTREIRRMEEEQKDWLEKNKKLILALALFSTPERIERIAEKQLGLSKVKPSKVLRVYLKRN